MLKDHLKNKNFDLMRINPFVRKVNKAFTSWKDHNIPLRKMYDYELFVLLEGELNFTYNTQTITLSSGEILIMPPFIMHKEFIKKDASARYFVVNFDLFYSPERAKWTVEDMYLNYCREGVVKMDEDPKYMRKDENAEVFAKPVTIKVKSVNSVIEVLQKMYEMRIRGQSDVMTEKDNIFLKSCFLQVLSMLLNEEEVGSKNKYGEQIEQFIIFVLKNYNTDLDINKKALELGFSPNFFRKVFKEQIGMTPFAYLLQTRIGEAKLLLAKGTRVGETAKRVGFTDALYFGKVFKKYVGVSPLEYKKSIADNTEFDVF